jgi:hypothetical protein
MVKIRRRTVRLEVGVDVENFVRDVSLLERIRLRKFSIIIFFGVTFFAHSRRTVKTTWKTLDWITKPWWTDWTGRTSWTHWTSVTGGTSFSWSTVFTDTWNTGWTWKTWWTGITSNAFT